ncbi:unnamed protein product [Closterium sp. Yama58-4]|nr:unnamed protein product [Closterium sp. Yama58-4]
MEGVLRAELLKLLPLVHPAPGGLGGTDGSGLACDVTKAKTAFAPYRICPLGAHIDHQGGPVLAAAINTGVRFLFLPTPTPQVVVASLQFRGTVQFSFSTQARLVKREKQPDDRNGGAKEKQGKEGGGEAEEEEQCWGTARGAMWALLEAGHRLEQGVVGVMPPHVPFCCIDLNPSGKSSGFNLRSVPPCHLHRQTGVAFLLALADANNLSLSPAELIELDRLIENGFLGLRNGVLDQSAIVLSKAGHLTRIWCQDRRHDFIPLPAGSPSEPNKEVAFMLAFSGMRAALTQSSGYNNRVQECQEAARMLLAAAGMEVPSSPVLSQVPLRVFETHNHRLPDALRRRAAHFYSESARVLQGAEALQQGDWRLFGSLMSESGQSSIEQYECGSAPLIDLRSILLATPGVLGVRFSGAGFRGCCVALVEREKVADVARHVAEEYSRRQPELAAACQKDSMVMVCDISDGARIL